MVTDALRSAIVNGAFAPNQRLVETDLAQQFGVGRAVVRSAIFELAKEGLVEHKPQKGAVVRAISLEEAIEIAELRSVVEGLCAAKAAQLATKRELTAIEANLAQMKLAVSQSDLFLYNELNFALHLLIHEASHHKTAAGVAGGLRNQSAQYHFRVGLLPGRPGVSLAEHEAVVEAIVARDPDRAQTAMQAHLESVIEALRDSAHRLGMSSAPLAYRRRASA
jgi:DNA-binding GntR family transcriptional regulator